MDEYYRMKHLSPKKDYWEKIYQQNYLEKRGWYEPTPKNSLDLIERSGITKTDAIIDIGGGDSLLVDHLLRLGYKNITVLDISQNALENSKKRLGPLAKKVKWIRTDIIDFHPETTYALWHDRACLHFLTDSKDIDQYRQKVKQGLDMNGTMIIGTFSQSGPEICSGKAIQQYSADDLTKLFSQEFILEEKYETPHHTPSMTLQNYVFCRLKRKTLIT